MTGRSVCDGPGHLVLICRQLGLVALEGRGAPGLAFESGSGPGSRSLLVGHGYRGFARSPVGAPGGPVYPVDLLSSCMNLEVHKLKL